MLFSSMWFILLIYFSLWILHGYSQVVGQETSYNVGKHHTWGWLVGILLSLCGILLNGVMLDLFLTVDIHQTIKRYYLNQALAIVDILFMTYTLCRCAISYSDDSFYAGFHQNTMCKIDAIVNTMFGLLSLTITVGITYKAKAYITSEDEISRQESQSYHKGIGWIIAAFLYSLIPGIVSLPEGGSSLESSGNYCLITLTHFTLPIVVPFLVIPYLLLFYNVYIIHIYISESQHLLKLEGIVAQAKGGYVQMIHNLSYLIVGVTVVIVGIITAVFYQYFTKSGLPPQVSLIMLTIYVFNEAIINPILFLFLNSDIKSKFIEKYYGLCNFIGNSIHMLSHTLYKSVSIVKPAMIYPEVTNDCDKDSREQEEDDDSNNHKNTDDNNDNMDYSNWKLWMTDYRLYPIFREYAQSVYAVENLLFYDDVKKYHNLANHLLEPEEYWGSLNQLAIRIYKIYIKAPIAPLEININSDTRDKITQKLLKIKLLGQDLRIESFLSNNESLYSKKSNHSNAIMTKASTTPTPRHSHSNNNNNNNIKESFMRTSMRTMSVFLPMNNMNQINKSDSNLLKDIMFPDITKYIGDEKICLVKEYITIFDEAFITVSKIIASDIWPRFLRSPIYKAALENHYKLLNDNST